MASVTPAFQTTATVGRPRSRRRAALWFAAAGAAAIVAAVAANHRPLAARLVTHFAFRDAERLAKELVAAKLDPGVGRAAVQELAERYGGWFRHGFCDREMLLARCPASFSLDRITPPALVLLAYLGARHPDLDSRPRAERVEVALAETREWLEVALHHAALKELLANLFTEDLVVEETGGDQGGLPKLAVFSWLLGEIDHPETLKGWVDGSVVEFRDRLAAGIPVESWQAVLRDCDHPREKVRAGALLLLHRHPDRSLAISRTRRALADPSEWVRLAAAGCLALEGEGGGEEVLLAGLDHGRWELRFWSFHGLAVLEERTYHHHFRRRLEAETDPWLKEQLRRFLEAGSESR